MRLRHAGGVIGGEGENELQRPRRRGSPVLAPGFAPSFARPDLGRGMACGALATAGARACWPATAVAVAALFPRLLLLQPEVCGAAWTLDGDWAEALGRWRQLRRRKGRPLPLLLRRWRRLRRRWRRGRGLQPPRRPVRCGTSRRLEPRSVPQREPPAHAEAWQWAARRPRAVGRARARRPRRTVPGAVPLVLAAAAVAAAAATVEIVPGTVLLVTVVVVVVVVGCPHEAPGSRPASVVVLLGADRHRRRRRRQR